MYLLQNLTVFSAVFFILFPFSLTKVRKEEKRKLEILHAGKPLEELVNLGAQVDPHDITVNGLAETIEPKLMEETHQERMMLQQNGIEDPYPLDATIEYEHKKKLPKPIIATETNPKDKSSFSYEDPEDTGYDSSNMPEYGVETKADFKANQEAADWLMHDPNKFNVMPDEDTKNLFNEDKESESELMDDPIRLDKDDEQDTEYQKFNDDNQDVYAKIQESLAPDSNMEKIYTKYEKFLNQFDQKLKGMNKKVKDENDYDDFENDVIDDEAGNDVTTDKDDAGKTDSLSIPSDVHSKGDETNSSEKELKGPKDDENKAKTTAEKIIASDEESKLKMLKELQEKIKLDEEKEIAKLKHKKEFSTTLSGGVKETSAESARQENKVDNQTSKSSGKSSTSTSDKSPSPVLPVFRIRHLHKPSSESQQRDVSPTVSAHSRAEKGISRQNVDVSRESFGLSRFLHPHPYSSNEYNGIAEQMMVNRDRYDHLHEQGISNLVRPRPRMPEPQSLHPQQPEDGQGRHGIPTRFGEWNGWSECSVTCDTGSQIRARICLKLPCQSRDLYQTRQCRKSICPGKWRKESLKAHNRIRALHHSPPLIWSNSLAQKAKELADNLASQDYIGVRNLHEENGESIAQLNHIKDSESIAQKAVDLWYDEIKSYSFSYPEFNPKNKHFIQMVWKKTKTLGMAATQSPDGGDTFVVALYGGADIDNNQLHDNVLREGKKHDVYTTFKRSRRPH